MCVFTIYFRFDNKLYIFGGKSKKYHNDIWYYDCRKEETKEKEKKDISKGKEKAEDSEESKEDDKEIGVGRGMWYKVDATGDIPTKR